MFVLKGGTAVLECRPESNPPAVITWLRNGQTLSGTGHQYSVYNVQPADEGLYTCKARNSRGSAQDQVQLSIGSKSFSCWLSVGTHISQCRFQVRMSGQNKLD